MSWIKENYEKASLGGALLITLGVGASIFLGGGEGVSIEVPSVTHNDNTSISELISIAKVMKDREEPAMIKDKSADRRENIDLFVGQPLYRQRNTVDPVDLNSEVGVGNVHKGMRNEWFIKYGIDLSYADSPDRDQDGDGFTNREEYDAKSLPNDASSYPNPIKKLAIDEVKVSKYGFRWSEIGDDTINIKFLVGDKPQNAEVKPGDIFFDDGPAKGRFKLGKRIQRENAHGSSEDAYVVEDLKPNRKDSDKANLTILKNGTENGWTTSEDLSVVLHLNALDKQSESFEVEEFDRFSLPYDAKAVEKPYLVKSITPVNGKTGLYQVVVEYLEKDETMTITLEARAKK